MHESFSNSSSNLTISISSVVSKPIKIRCLKSIAKKKTSILAHRKVNNKRAKVKVFQKDVISKLIIDIKKIELSNSFLRKQNKNCSKIDKLSLNVNKVLINDKMETKKESNSLKNLDEIKTEQKSKIPAIIKVKCDESKENYDRKVIYINHFKSESKVYHEKSEKNKKITTNYKSMENLQRQDADKSSKNCSKKHLMKKEDFLSSVILNFKDPFYKSLFFPEREDDKCKKSKNLRDAYLALA